MDSALARAALEDVGFGRVIEAGLGREPASSRLSGPYLPRTQTGPGTLGRCDRRKRCDGSFRQARLQVAGQEWLEECCLTLLAGRTVGAAFVGTVTASIVVAELLRMVLGDRRYDVIDGTLRSLGHRRLITSEVPDEPFNPGTMSAASSINPAA